MDISFLENTELPVFVVGLLCLSLLIQLYYILCVYSRLAMHKIRPSQEQNLLPPATIIICAYNEEENLKKFLPKILAQDYPQFEIIVVDDCSNDDTKWVLKEICEQHSNIRVIEIQEHVQLKHNKKFALTIGIKGAKYNHLLMTDADCEPASDQWLRNMMQGYSKPEKEIVLGYSPYFRQKGLLNALIRFETTHTAMTYLSLALKKNAYMGVGRNLSYTKELFFKGKGFNAHMHIKSGDDDLFINHNATPKNTTIAIHPNAHVYSEPKNTWNSYYKQKARHSTASVEYKSKHKNLLTLQIGSAFFFYILLVASYIIVPEAWIVITSIYAIRLLAQTLVYYPIFKKLAVKDLFWFLPILDIFYYLFISINGVFNRHKKQISWS